jgi:hypothetical protein
MERYPERCGSAGMKDDRQAVRMMMQIGALLRLNMRDLANEPMRLQVIHQIRTQPERDGLAALSLVPYEPLPEQLQRLVERLRINGRKGADDKNDEPTAVMTAPAQNKVSPDPWGRRGSA